MPQDRRRKRPARKPPGQRQLEKSLKQLDGVLAALALPDTLAAVTSIVFSFGASASRPYEAYEIRLGHAQADAVESERGAAAAADVARRVTRALVSSLFDAPFAARSGCRVNVLLQVRRAAADAAPPSSAHWVLKRTLRPAWHRAVVLRAVHLRYRHGADGDPPPPGGDGASIKEAHAAATAAYIHASCIRPVPPSRCRDGPPVSPEAGDSDGEHLWYQCRAVFKAPQVATSGSSS